MRACAFLILAGLTAAAVGCGKKEESGGGGGGASQASLQGKWSVADVDLQMSDMGDVKDAKTKAAIQKQLDAMRSKIREEMASVEVAIKDNNITATKPGEKKDAHATFTLDNGKTPAQFDLTPSDDDGPKNAKGTRETVHGIYKLEGDTLTVAVAAGGKDPPRPTEFKATAGGPGKSGVVVITLKKK